jgi:hypothetical protein
VRKREVRNALFQVIHNVFLPWFFIISGLKLCGRKEMAKKMHTIWEARRQPHINPSCWKKKCYKWQTLHACYIFIKARHCILLSPNQYSERSNTYIDCWCLMASSNALLVLGVFMLLMTTFVAGDVADTIRHKLQYLSYKGLGCDPKKNPWCLNPPLSRRGCKAKHRCRQG